MKAGREFRARPVKPFERGRPCLRRTRAYANSKLERSGIAARRGRAAGQDTRDGRRRNELPREMMAKSVGEEKERWGRVSGKA